MSIKVAVTIPTGSGPVSWTSEVVHDGTSSHYDTPSNSSDIQSSAPQKFLQAAHKIAMGINKQAAQIVEDMHAEGNEELSSAAECGPVFMPTAADLDEDYITIVFKLKDDNVNVRKDRYRRIDRDWEMEDVRQHLCDSAGCEAEKYVFTRGDWSVLPSDGTPRQVRIVLQWCEHKC